MSSAPEHIVLEKLGEPPRLLGPVAHFRISTDAMGRGSLDVNGQDLSDKTRQAVLIVQPGEPTTLQLSLRGGGDIEGDGIVKVILDDDQAEVPLAQAVLRFLDGVDPAELEQRILLDGAMNSSPGTAVLAALKQMALA